MLSFRCPKLMAGFVLTFFVFISLFRCSHEPEKALTKSPVKSASAEAVAVTAHPLATKVALSKMKEGGNVVDAFVAVSLMLSVVTPQSTGIGGGGFLLYYDAKSKDVKAYDFRERAPFKATERMFVSKKNKPLPFFYDGVFVPKASLNGPLSVGTPGLIAGLWEIHKKYGKLPWSELVEPAAVVAEKGFEIDSLLAKALKKREKILSQFEGSREVFFKKGRVLKEGDFLVQRDLAKTLFLIGKYGRDGFYKGEVAEGILKALSKGGILTQRDLDEYKVKEHPAVRASYKSYHIASMPPPSSGGVHIAQILNMLEQDDLAAHGAESPEAVHLVSEAMRRAYRDRASFLGDPDFFDVPMGRLISKGYAEGLRKGINPKKALQIEAHDYASYYEESESTTHFSLVDFDGNAVSSTQTINYSFGSCVVAKGTGVILNDEMDDFSSAPGVPNAYGLSGSDANKIEPGKTMLSSMSPTLVFSKDGSLKMVLGSPGGARIITATLQTILNVLEYKMPLQKAVDFPRFHHQWLPNKLYLEEKDFSKETLRDLRKIGHAMETPTWTMGNVQAILVQDEGGLVGASDKRGIGSWQSVSR